MVPELLVKRVRIAAVSGIAFLAVQLGWYGHIFPYTSDTASYTGIAWQVVHAGHLADPVAFFGRPVPDFALHWPPGYPLILAALASVGLDIVASGQALSVLAIGVVVALVTATMASLFRGRALALAIAWTVLNPALTLAAQRVTSDPLFSALAFFTLILAGRAAGRPGARVAWFAVGLLAASATGMRWAGVALVPAVAVSWFIGPPRPFWSRVVSASLTCLGASMVLLPLAWWWLQVGDGPRVPFDGSPWTVLAFACRGFSDVILVGTLGAGAVPLLLALGSARRGDALPSAGHARSLALVHGTFVSAFLTLLVATGFFVYFDGLDLRTLAPMVPSTLILGGLGAMALRPRLTRRLSRLPALAIGFVCVVLLHKATLLNALVSLPNPKVASRDVAAIASLLPASSDVPVLTVNAMLAVPRPDLLWRRPQRGPNDTLVPLTSVLSAHPEHRGGLVLFPRELAGSWARSVHIDACVLTTCLGRLPAGH